jgi:hypothetical protein
MRAVLLALLVLGSFACHPRETASPRITPAADRRPSALDAAVHLPASRDGGALAVDAGADRARDGETGTPRRSDGPLGRASSSAVFYMNEEVFHGGYVTDDARGATAFAAPSSRSGRAPSQRALLEAMRAQLSSTATFALEGGFNAVGDGRFVIVVRRTDRATGALVVLVVVASELDGRAQLEGAAEVPTDFAAESASTCRLTVRGREMRDLDLDGEPELALAISYCGPQSCPFGHTIVEALVVFDLTPGLSIVALVERELRSPGPERGLRRLRTRWRDVDRDGHPDLVVDGEDCGFIQSVAGEEEDTRTAAELGCSRRVAPFANTDETFGDSPVWCCVTRHEVALYNPRTDAWRPARPGARLNTTAPCAEGGE